jgi:hypothetical protein
MENRIRECQLDLLADTMPAATMRANQLRLVCGHEPLDLLLRMSQEGRVAHLLEDRVPAHGKIRAINLQLKAGVYAALILDPHCRSQRG